MRSKLVSDWLKLRLELFLAVIIILVALYVVILDKFFLEQLSGFHAQIEQKINELSPFPVKIKNISGDMQLLTPEIVVEGLQVFSASGDSGGSIPRDYENELLIEVPSIRIEIDVLSSLLRREPRLQHLYFEGIHLDVLQDEEGKWKLPVSEKFKIGSDKESKNKQGLEKVIKQLYTQKRISLVKTKIDIESKEFFIRRLEEVNLTIRNSGKHHVLAAAISVGGKEDLALDIIFNYTGDPRSLEELAGDFYANVRQISWPQKYKAKRWKDLLISTGQGGFEVWGSLNTGKLNALSGSIVMENLQGQWKKDPLVSLSELSADFNWQHRSDDVWFLDIEGLKIGANGHKTRPLNIFVEQKRIKLDFAGLDKQETVIYLDKLNLKSINAFLEFLPERLSKVKELLAEMQPAGSVNNFQVDLKKDGKNALTFNVKGALHNASIHPVGKTPGVTGLDAYFEMTRDKGWIRLSSHNTELFLGSLYTRPMMLEEVTGDIVWEKTDNLFEVKSGLLSVINPEASIYAVLRSQKHGKEVPKLNLIASLYEGDASYTMKYVPDLKLGAGLVNWLSSSNIKGDITYGGFLYNGPVKILPVDQQYRTNQMRFLLTDGEVKFQPDWPRATNLTCDLLINGRKTILENITGKLYETRLYDLDLLFPPVFTDADIPKIYLTGKSKGDASDILKILTRTGLKKFMPKELSYWEGRGNTDGEYKLEIPLLRGHEVISDVRAELSDASFISESLNLNFYQVDGELRYQTEKGVYGSGITALLFDEALDMNVTTDLKSSLTQVKATGKMEVEKIYGWSEQIVLEPIHGVIEHETTLSLYPDSGSSVSRSHLEVNSNLKGARFDYPEPLGKSAKKQMNMKFKMSLGADKQEIFFTLGKNLKARMQVNDFGLLKGHVVFGMKKDSQLKEANGIYIDGYTESLSVEKWIEQFEYLDGVQTRLDSNKSALMVNNKGDLGSVITSKTQWDEKDIIDRVKVVRLMVKDLDVYSGHIDAARLEIGRDGKAWSVFIDSAAVLGKLTVPDTFEKRGQTPVNIDMRYVRYPFDFVEAGVGESQGAGSSVSMQSDLEPIDIIPSDTTVSEFYFEGKPYGKVSFSSRPSLDDKYKTVFNDLDFSYQGIHFNGTSEWFKKGDELGNHFLGTGQAKNMATVLQAWGYSENVESKYAQLRADVRWKGLPTDVDYNNLQGDIWVHVKDGRVLNTDANTSALKALSIFNVANLTRRLQLDFKDLTGKGVPFDGVKAVFTIDNAILRTVDMEVKAPFVHNIKVTGTTDLENEMLDQYVDITLPITLGPVSCLLDPVSCAEALTNKDKRSDLNTVQYHVTGSWSDPVVEEIKGLMRN